MPRTFRTAAGQTVELDARIFGDHLRCTGCTTDWQAPVGAGEKAATAHAADCQAKPQAARK